MSYELLRIDILKNLSELLSPDDLNAALDAIDRCAAKYEISVKSTALAVIEEIPEALKMYVAALSVENRSRATVYNYFCAMRNFFRTVRKSVETVTTNDIRLYLYRYKAEKRVKDSTIETLRIVINSFFEWCVGEDLIPKNPCRKISTIHYQDAERIPMTHLELEQIRFACKEPRERALVDFLFSTGCRISEAANVRLSNIDWRENTVLIEHGKGDKQRTTYLNAKAIVSLQAYLATRSDDCEYLFVDSRYKRHKHKLSRKALENEIENIVSRSGIDKHITPHYFRHTAATLALQAGMPIEQVQRFLGHANIKTTLRYAKVSDKEVKANHQKYIA